MISKKMLIALVAVFTLLNAGLLLASNEPYSKFYSGYGTDDPDSDLDGVSGIQDKCPLSPFDIWALTTETKKQKSVVTFSSPADLSKSVYLRLKSVDKKKTAATIETSSDAKFSGSKTYKINSAKPTTIDSIGRRFKVLYSNATKGFAVIWSGAPEQTGAKGCTTEESKPSALEELTPP